jgi:hypothetical protein
VLGEPATAIDPSGIDPSGIDPRGEAARPIEPSGIEPSGAEAASPDPDEELPTLEAGTAEVGTVSTPATVGEVVERDAVTVLLPFMFAEYQAASFAPPPTFGTPSHWPRTT